MKDLLTKSIFLLSSLSVFGQTLEERIDAVESNLHLQTITSADVMTLGHSIQAQLASHKIPGASVAVIEDGEIAWTKTYGTIKANSSDKITENTLFQCASIGKVITAIALLQLVDKGLIELGEPVNNKLTKWKIADNEQTQNTPVTLRHLLSHSAGLTDGYGFMGYESDDELPTVLQILNNEAPSQDRKSLEIKTIPGTKELYSGAGYLIIQLLIEELTQQRFDQYIAKNIFEPLKMSHSTYAYQPDKLLSLNVAHGHVKGGTPIKGRAYNFYPEKGAAGPWTTAKDLGLFALAIINAYHGSKELQLNQETIREMLQPQINHKGLGVNLKGFEATEAFWHAGQNLGYTALFYGTLQSKSGAIVLLNGDYGERFMQEFVTSVATIHNWPVMKSYQINLIPDHHKKQMSGVYLFSEKDKKVYIREKKGSLFMSQSKKGKGYELLKIGDNHYTFQGAQDYYKISFEDDFKTINYFEGPNQHAVGTKDSGL